MSPSQVFQFCYNAQCSYFDATYHHAVARFFHSMVTSGNGIADLTKLPIRLMEVNLGHPLVLRPLFGAMMFCPLIYGVVCYDMYGPTSSKRSRHSSSAIPTSNLSISTAASAKRESPLSPTPFEITPTPGSFTGTSATTNSTMSPRSVRL
jgi:hypothetical protein